MGFVDQQATAVVDVHLELDDSLHADIEAVIGGLARCKDVGDEHVVVAHENILADGVGTEAVVGHEGDEDGVGIVGEGVFGADAVGVVLTVNVPGEVVGPAALGGGEGGGRVLRGDEEWRHMDGGLGLHEVAEADFSGAGAGGFGVVVAIEDEERGAVGVEP